MNSDDFAEQTKKWTKMTKDMFSVGKIRKQYQEVRKWYAEQNKPNQHVSMCTESHQ